MDKNKWEVLDEVRKIQTELVKVDKEGWYNNEFLTWNWWLLLGILIVPWIVYIVLCKRSRIVSTMLVGMIVALVTMLFDVTGSDYGFWGYPVELVRPGPGAFAFDLGMVPVVIMLIFQFFPLRKEYGVALVVMALVFSFIGEPLSHKFELIIYYKWKYIYSFCYYILIGVSVKTFTDKLLKIEEKARR
ncbi:CBO0543 family protein [Bacillus sp. AK128]